MTTGSDRFCFACHRDAATINCKTCPRSFHPKCIGNPSETRIVCGDCTSVMAAENLETRSTAMRMVGGEELRGMLELVVGRVRGVSGVDSFLQPVSPSEAEDYYDYITYPMDIALIEKNIQDKIYGSTEGFLADLQWIVHNSIVFNSATSPYTQTAKRILKVAKAELAEIENCPECYRNAHSVSNWFIQVCPLPHPVVWAKLKGFPFWPGKAMRVNGDSVDVRFFGEHDRAWVKVGDCYLYSEERPASGGKKNTNFEAAMMELDGYTQNIKLKYGEFIALPIRTPLGDLSLETRRRQIPGLPPSPEPPPAKKPRLNPPASPAAAVEQTPDAADADADAPPDAPPNAPPDAPTHAPPPPQLSTPPPPTRRSSSSSEKPKLTAANPAAPEYRISRDISICKVGGGGGGQQQQQQRPLPPPHPSTLKKSITLPGGTITVTPLPSMNGGGVVPPTGRKQLERNFMEAMHGVWRSVEKHLEEREREDGRHGYEILLSEQKARFDTEKAKLLKRIAALEAEKADAKKRQWCAECGREALFYCCWNTSYCGYKCQESHWSAHMATCTQKSGGGPK